MDNFTDLSYISGILYKGLSEQKRTLEQKITNILNRYAEVIKIISKCPHCFESYKKLREETK